MRGRNGFVKQGCWFLGREGSDVSLVLLARMWKVYVERMAMYGAAVLMLAPSGLHLLGCAQRRAARMLLGFGSRSPSPAVLGEVGWLSWSSALLGERIKLCKRLSTSPCVLTRLVLDASVTVEGSWAFELVHACAAWGAGGREPATRSDWDGLYRRWLKDVSRVEAEERWVECMSHRSLLHYFPGVWICEGRWGVNHFVHDRRVGSAASRALSRFMVGGQGLRAGDVGDCTAVDVCNCCVWCLKAGRKCVENLRHVVFECMEYASARSGPCIRRLLEEGGDDLFLLHSGRWNRREIRCIRDFFLEILAMRSSGLGGRPIRSSRLQAEAEKLWFD